MTQVELSFEVSPPMPAHGTQCYELLVALQNGVRLTIWNAMADYHCGALHQRIKELRDLGWPIKRRLLQTPNNKNVAEFYL